MIGKTSRTMDLERSIDDAQNLDTYLCQIIGERNGQRKLVVRRRDRNFILISVDDKMYFIKQTKRTSSSVDFIANGRLTSAYLPTEGIREEAKVRSDVASINELVSSNFPSKVVSIRVSKGSKQKEGDTLLVLEAMKMEAQIKAPKDCDVVEVFVREGEMVARGTKLLQLKFRRVEENP